MKFSLIHPTRNRPQKAFETFLKWREKADVSSWEYILSIDTGDNSDYTRFSNIFNDDKVQEGWIKCHKKLVCDNKSAIQAINNAAKIATGDLIVVISDDFDCPEHWDTLLLNELAGKSDFIVKTQDGLQKTLITLPIMDRVYYSRFGYIYHPDYLHMHCDEEMTIVGHMLGKVITLDLLFPHNHYTTGAMQMDEINIKNNSTWAHGQATLDRRSFNNFGIENPLVKREDIAWR